MRLAPSSDADTCGCQHDETFLSHHILSLVLQSNLFEQISQRLLYSLLAILYDVAFIYCLLQYRTSTRSNQGTTRSASSLLRPCDLQEQ